MANVSIAKNHRAIGHDVAVRHPSGAAVAPHQGKPYPVTSRNGRMRFRFWYDAIIDWMLLNSDKPLKQCAKDLGRSEDTIYTITSSDIFKARYAQRRQEFNERLQEQIGDAASGVALAAMTEIQRRIVSNAAAIPTVVLNDIANKTLERIGYGVAPVAQTVINNNTGPTLSVSVDTLREAKAAMQEVHRQNSTIIDVEPAKLSSKETRDLESLL